MARTTLPQTDPIGPYPTLPVGANALDAVMTAADVANLNQILASNAMIILVQNTDTVDHTVTFTSAPDLQKRTGDIANYTVNAGEIAVLKMDQFSGWVQSDGYIYLQANNAAVKIGVIRQ